MTTPPIDSPRPASSLPESAAHDATVGKSVVWANTLFKRSVQVWSAVGVIFLGASVAQIASSTGASKAATPVVAAAVVAPAPAKVEVEPVKVVEAPPAPPIAKAEAIAPALAEPSKAPATKPVKGKKASRSKKAATAKSASAKK